MRPIRRNYSLVLEGLVIVSLLLNLPSMRIGAGGDEARARQIVRDIENAPPIRAFLVANRCFVRGYVISEKATGAILNHAAIVEGAPRATIVIPNNDLAAPRENAHFSLQSDRLIFANRHFGNLMLYNLTDFLNGKVTTGDGPNKRTVTSFDDAWIFGEQNPLPALHGPAGGPYGPYEDFHYDYIPLSKDSVRLVILAQRPIHALPGQPVKKKLKSEKGMSWLFTSAKYQAKWDTKEGKWIPGAWSDPEVLEAPFTEPFHAYLLNANYYFVTKSGKVYVSPPAKAGENAVRKVTPFWTDAQQAITHVLTDVDGPTPHLTYAFGTSSRVDAQKKRERFHIKLQGQEASPTYFRVGQLQPAPNVDEPLKTMLEYARLIRFGPQADTAIGPDVNMPSTERSTWWWYPVGAFLAAVLAAAFYFYRRSRIARG